MAKVKNNKSEEEVVHGSLYNLSSGFIKYVGKMSSIVAAVTLTFTAIGWVATKIWHKEIQDITETIEFGRVSKDSIIPMSDIIHESINKRIDSIQFYLIEKSKTEAIGLRVDELGDLWYKAPDLKLYRAYYYVEYDAYYYTDANGYFVICH